MAWSNVISALASDEVTDATTGGAAADIKARGECIDCFR
jgi:hypothetical protein